MAFLRLFPDFLDASNHLVQSWAEKIVNRLLRPKPWTQSPSDYENARK